VEKYFSKQFIYKRKEGFGVPLEKWFLNSSYMGKYVDMLLEPKTLQRGFFSENHLRKMINDLRKNSLPLDDYEGILWTAVNFELWNRIFIDQ
jgi:asparagine synthase (glutamine-hydrolysing)